jgi:hypothetical protein
MLMRPSARRYERCPGWHELSTARPAPLASPAASDFPAGRKSAGGIAALANGAGVGRALDRHPGRVAAVEHDQQAARRSCATASAKSAARDRAAADPAQVEVVGDQEVFAAFDVAVAAEVEDRRRVAVRHRRQFVGQPVEPVEDRLAAAPSPVSRRTLSGA